MRLAPLPLVLVVLAACLEVPSPPLGRRKALIIPAGRVAETLIDFPVLVRLSGDPDLMARAAPDGLDITFRTPDGALLAFERVHWDLASGDLQAWVKLPTISRSADTRFFLHYGGAASVDESAPAEVWSNGHAMVWHLDEAPIDIKDSTENRQHAVGVSGAARTAPGYLGNALHLDGRRDYITFGESFPAEVDAGAQLTVTAWAMYEQPSSWAHFINKGTSSNAVGWAMGIDGDHRFLVRAMNGSEFSRGWNSAATPDVGVWYHWALVYDGTQDQSSGRLRGYLDGVEHPLTYDGAIPETFDARGGSLFIGCATWFPDQYCIQGAVDEVHVSVVPRSAAWIQAQYDSQVAGATFVRVEPEEPL